MAVVGIIGAMEEEVKLLLENAASVEKKTCAGLDFYRGTAAGENVVIVRSGIGKVNAALCTQFLICEYGVSCVINTGIAGGVVPGLSLLDFIVSTDAVQQDFDVRAFGYDPGVIPRMETSFFPADKRMVAAAETAHRKGGFTQKLIPGRIASGDVFVAERSRKEQIYGMFRPLCVEMEGAAVAQVCAVNGIPFVIVRCISDLAETKTEEFYEEKAGALSASLVLGMLAEAGAFLD